MAEAAASLLVENVTQLLKHQTNLTSGAENELQQLNQDVDRLKAFLQHVRKNPKEEKGELKDMEKQIRDVVHEVEDKIDDCLSQKAAANQKNPIRRRFSSNKKHAELQKVVKSLRETVVKSILNKVNANNSTVTAPTETVQKQPPTSRGKFRLMRKGKVVGLKDEEERISGYLLEENEGLDVICITGTRGLGKTTLTSKIYDSERIAFSFPVRVRIYVSQEFNKRKVMLKILSHFTAQDISSMSDEELSQTVLACLEGEKFLLVFDDVCRVEDWRAIQEFLPTSNGKGKVVITSTKGIVGASDCRKTLELRKLSEQESWTLLQLEVFGNLKDCPRELEAFGRLIARKCGGLPLQIVVVAGILVSHLTKSLWEKVSQNVDLFEHIKCDRIDLQ